MVVDRSANVIRNYSKKLRAFRSIITSDTTVQNLASNKTNLFLTCVSD